MGPFTCFRSISHLLSLNSSPVAACCLRIFIVSKALSDQLQICGTERLSAPFLIFKAEYCHFPGFPAPSDLLPTAFLPAGFSHGEDFMRVDPSSPSHFHIFLLSAVSSDIFRMTGRKEISRCCFWIFEHYPQESPPSPSASIIFIPFRSHNWRIILPISSFFCM